MTDVLLSRKTRNQKHDVIEETHNYNILLDTREIFLCSEGDNEDNGIDFKVANKFLKNLRILESNGDGPIIIHQHSIGGDFFEGLLIYDAILNSKCHIIFVMHGVAASMGSVIPQAADTRIIMPSCVFMVHEGYTGIDSDYTCKQSRSFLEIEDKLLDLILDIYCNVCKNGLIFQKDQADSKTVRSILKDKITQKQDWWLFAREAVNYGFADAVLGDEGYESLNIIKESIISE